MATGWEEYLMVGSIIAAGLFLIKMITTHDVGKRISKTSSA